MSTVTEALGGDVLDFAPDILRLQSEPPSPMPRLVLYLIGTLLSGVLAWSLIGKLDIIAVAPGRLVPTSYVKVVQPAQAGIIKDILVREGDLVTAGQVLVRMDPSLADADGRQLTTQLQLVGLSLRRIEAELAGVDPKADPRDTPELFAQMLAQYRSHRQAQNDAIDAQKAVVSKTEQDLSGALEMESKLRQTLPIVQDQQRSWSQLYKEGFAGRLLAEDRKRALIEAQQELKAQSFAIQGYRATITQSRKRIAQLDSNYRQQLYNEQMDTTAQYQKAQQDRDKQTIRQGLLELKAPQEGIVKDLATHTEGAVLSPGSVLMTIVPAADPVRAEVWVSNLDRGFVRAGQNVKVKIAPYPFQKYGMVDGMVVTISADSNEQPPADGGKERKDVPAGHGFRSLVVLKSQYLQTDGVQHLLSPGMQVDAEIALGNRTIMDYVLSPVRKAFQEAARER